jgi:uncharacterized lipoprotein YehR (DUF1307 family)
MSFEKVVLQKVAKVLKQERQAHFMYGTLFVECTEEQARKVFHKLSKDYGLGKVQITKTPEEFAFDFVA